MLSSCSLDSCRNASTAALSDASEATSFDDPSFASVTGTDARLFEELSKLQTLGVALPGCSGSTRCYTLRYGGEVPQDGNCLFESLALALGGLETGAQVRARCVARFRSLEQAGQLPPDVEQRIRNQYAPDLSSGWGLEAVQEHKLLVPVADLGQADAEIAARMGAGLDWSAAAAGVYQELGRPVDCAAAWGAYMALRGGRGDEHCIVSLKHTEEGLYAVELGGPGQGAFGDDLAIEVLATEYQRDIYVVQAHGAETGFEGAPALFFLPHAPLVRAAAEPDQAAAAHPLFLLMKGRDWCCAGADHYEPLLSQKRVMVPGKSAAPYIDLGKW